MNNIYLKNKGVIDLDFFKFMGVNVKESDNPIGQFGTGLKYAVAVFLREGINFSLYSGGNCFEFHTRTKTMRGKDFEVCCLSGSFDTIELPFTTELGKNWKPWMAYREIYSNCLDEDGKVSTSTMTPDEESTLFIVENREEFSGTFLNKNEEPIVETEDLEVYEGGSDHIYMNGIRVFTGTPCKYTYNIKKKLYLTEDRTIQYVHQIKEVICSALQHCGNAEFIKDIITTGSGYFESRLNLEDNTFSAPSKVFTETVAATEPSYINREVGYYLEAHKPKPELSAKEEFINEIKNVCNSYGANIEQYSRFKDDDSELELIMTLSLGYEMEKDVAKILDSLEEYILLEEE